MVILITGASSGLGQALAKQLSQKGHIVYGTSRKAAEHPADYNMLVMDVTQAQSVQAAVEQVMAEQGRLDVLINNAGIGIAGPFEQLEQASMEHAMQTNFFGVVHTCQSAIPFMRRQNSGKIINISSIGALFGLPYRGVYGATKAAVDVLTESLRMELKPFNIQLCSIHAGDIQTNINANRIKNYDPSDPTYKASFEKVYAAIDADVDKGTPAAVVAAHIVQVVESTHVKRAYRVGKTMQKLSVVAKRILPATWFEKIILSYSGM
ncbi:MAG TPA: SDR family oxidoreductase [Saprospiraceae bacterium]|nr:SDR family oxidoreductase [Saprospiraceae bacterium]HMQ81957.1 SDR family oxidoreductase [Saprospiraceae bacterium]